MSDKYFHFLNRLHKTARIFGYIVTWGGFLGFIILFTVLEGFPKGLVLGVIFGGLFAIMSWLGMRKSLNDSAKARDKLQAYAEGQKDALTPSRQQSYAIYGALATSILSFILLFSCLGDSCNDDLTRIQLFFITIGTGVAVGFLFYEERVKGKAALVTLLLLILVDIFFLGRVFFLW